MTADANRRYKEISVKKITSLMLGLSLILGTAAFAADEKKADTTAAPAKEKKAKKAKKAKTETAPAEKATK
jgi:hypothetical protein